MSECNTINCPTCGFAVSETFVEQKCPRCQALIESKFVCGSCHHCGDSLSDTEQNKEKTFFGKLFNIFK